MINENEAKRLAENLLNSSSRAEKGLGSALKGLFSGRATGLELFALKKMSNMDLEKRVKEALRDLSSHMGYLSDDLVRKILKKRLGI